MSIVMSSTTEMDPVEGAPAEGAGTPRVRTVIRPAEGWQLINFRELWQFRELFFFLAWRDVKVRYKQTALGAAWAVLQPALMMVVFTIIFSRMAQVPTEGIPYPVFAYAGLLPWTFFATGITNAGNSVIGSERLITKIYFPRLAIPFSSVGAAFVDFVVALGLLLVLGIYYHIIPGLGLLAVPIILSALALASLGLGTLLAALNVYYRDFRYVIPYLVQLGMFATPSVYMEPRDGGGGLVPLLLALNPINTLVAAFRAAVLARPIAWEQVAIASLVAAALFLGGCIYFRRVEDQFADFI